MNIRFGDVRVRKLGNTDWGKGMPLDTKLRMFREKKEKEL